jgi:hypothetical protein
VDLAGITGDVLVAGSPTEQPKTTTTINNSAGHAFLIAPPYSLNQVYKGKATLMDGFSIVNSRGTARAY